jgi:hypothetical protein
LGTSEGGGGGGGGGGFQHCYLFFNTSPIVWSLLHDQNVCATRASYFCGSYNFITQEVCWSCCAPKFLSDEWSHTWMKIFYNHLSRTKL